MKFARSKLVRAARWQCPFWRKCIMILYKGEAWMLQTLLAFLWRTLNILHVSFTEEGIQSISVHSICSYMIWTVSIVRDSESRTQTENVESSCNADFTFLVDKQQKSSFLLGCQENKERLKQLLCVAFLTFLFLACTVQILQSSLQPRRFHQSSSCSWQVPK